MKVPPARGGLSTWLTDVLRDDRTTPVPEFTGSTADVWSDDDFQLALWCCYELHYRGFDDVPDALEWDPRVLAFRAGLERAWLACLQDLHREHAFDLTLPVPTLLRQVVKTLDGPPLARYLQREATVEQFREFVMHRSVYQLKEADPHTFGIPRLDPETKAALVEIQADEYGGGQLKRMHATLFGHTMRWLGLSDEYGRYVPEAPGPTLAVSNVMSFFALHRRWIGALVGHLAALEMTSTEPNRRYAAGIRRLGGDDTAAWYFDEHVEADAVHEQIAAHDLCGSFVAHNPDALVDVVFGAASCLRIDALAAEHLMAGWDREKAPCAGSVPAA
ncbi:iron-containing redox enzyme family protein [Phytoactinopolyspora alkaliphila]|uniref:Iron-containing redox enzyme family protein n=1 Tax=Phytoactinopolyspora alkaliphila TaxID=1783498 RepID=A0A6N9YNP1_9ACTN|nr:iron-containing redox enzyme family protein [Phytoactinopolyspora alkaliphila]NED96550.1 iron-containing redox enzyme family protein [Phytoactinopolyspora alkaliphila]